MKKQITPQEKKIQSYVSDRRNMYGESRSSAIKSIRKQKAIVNRHYRRTSAEQLRAGKKLNEPDEILATIHCIKRKRWKNVQTMRWLNILSVVGNGDLITRCNSKEKQAN